ncbi:MAG: EB domain-containing protein, partial [Myxococcota bacterium]|nr:EB domain-containing protein [Myxococcota bacterium]
MCRWLPSHWPAVVCLTLLLSTVGCVQLERQGGPCSSDGDCSMGLTCRHMRCRSPSDSPEPGLTPVMDGLRKSASREPPRERDDAPPELLQAARAIGGEVRIDVFTNRHLPERVKLMGGREYQAAATAERLVKRISGLAIEIPGLSLGKRMGVSEEQAVQERLHVLRSDTGVPLFVGAVVRVGVRREVIPSFAGPEAIDHALAAGLWRLHARKQGRLRVGFICTGGAFCPRIEPKPKRRSGDDWPDNIATALSEVFGPFDEIRAESMAEFQEHGIQPLAIMALQPIPEHVDVLALVVPSQPLATETQEWLLGLRNAGRGLILLLPGARMMASRHKLAAIDTGHAALLTGLGLRRVDPLLADRASLAKFKAPDRVGADGDLLPLVAEISRISAFHGAVTGRYGL